MGKKLEYKKLSMIPETKILVNLIITPLEMLVNLIIIPLKMLLITPLM